jgi:RNA polymerase sigma-70 factor (ECF subfamily)
MTDHGGLTVPDGEPVDHGMRAATDGPRLHALYDQHHARVLRLCTSLLGSEVDAEDAAQETFLRVMTRMRLLSGEIGAYLTIVARHLCYRELARRARWDAHDGSARSLTATDSHLDETQRLLLQRVWAELSPSSRHLLGHFIAGYSYVEIAGITGMSVSAVTSRVWRARQHARTLIR